MTAAPANPPGRQLASPELNARLGRVIRTKRTLLGLSQEALGNRLGITFQQVQKYEKGTNQVTFARLVDLARVLGTSVGDLVDAALGEDAPLSDTLSDRETLELLKRFEALKPNQRRGVRLLVHNLAEAV